MIKNKIVVEEDCLLRFDRGGYGRDAHRITTLADALATIERWGRLFKIPKYNVAKARRDVRAFVRAR